MMRIGILEAGRPAPALLETHGDYIAMFESLLAPAMPEAEFLGYAAIDGHLPRSLDEADGWLITGSAFGVYDRDPWIGALKKFAREAIDRGQPVFGICFGHQLVAEIMGGRAEKSDAGWGIGVHDYAVRAPADWMADAPSRFGNLVSHQDQVTVPPPGAKLLAGSDFCPNAMLEILPNAATLQSHPEMPAAYCRDLYESRRERIGAATVDEALASLANPIDAALVAGWIGNFFRKNLNG
ncbi:gamma-glutamyl-gamma-aminobutyrate hydrolase family protein [Marivibrio halodurans]|nr:gamma-glutamyl-gamma-aminobutyrate hydrolase family protein [Marivibrio halodurans]